MKYMLSALLMVRDQSIPELAAVINKTRSSCRPTRPCISTFAAG